MQSLSGLNYEFSKNMDKEKRKSEILSRLRSIDWAMEPLLEWHPDGSLISRITGLQPDQQKDLVEYVNRYHREVVLVRYSAEKLALESELKGLL